MNKQLSIKFRTRTRNQLILVIFCIPILFLCIYMLCWSPIVSDEVTYLKLKELTIGMSTNEVIALIGQPLSISKEQSADSTGCYTYCYADDRAELFGYEMYVYFNQGVLDCVHLESFDVPIYTLGSDGVKEAPNLQTYFH